MISLQHWHIDKPLLIGLILLSCISLLVLYSASLQTAAIPLGQLARLAIGFGVMLAVAQIRPEHLTRWSPYIFAIGLLLLLVVLAVGADTKGAQRWLNLGLFKFQPSEIMKLGVPMMTAWYLARQNLPPKSLHIAVALLIVLIPSYLIALQPDLGTALLITGSGVFVIFLAGMNWLMIIGLLTLAGAAVPMVWTYLMHEYQRQRVLMLFDPTLDPLGAGYHTIQSMIAVGSGGFFGKGWLNGSQARLDFLPESSTDFIFAVFAEEFGLIGIVVLFSLYVFVVLRGLFIAFYAQETYARLLAGSLTLTFFLYFFVNIGMVTGILPVVGVPLPIISYGGSSIVTLMAAFGILMSIHTHRRIAQA